MEDEAIKQQYIILQTKLYKVKTKIKQLLEDYDKLLINTKDNIIIDDEVDGYELFQDINKKLKLVENDLVYEIIPRVNNKL